MAEATTENDEGEIVEVEDRDPGVGSAVRAQRGGSAVPSPSQQGQ